jgi:hypothetical protein
MQLWQCIVMHIHVLGTLTQGFFPCLLLSAERQALGPLVIIVTSNKATWHNTRDFDLTYFWRSQRSKFKMAPLVGTFRYYFTLNILTLWEHVSIGTIYISTIFLPYENETIPPVVHFVYILMDPDPTWKACNQHIRLATNMKFAGINIHGHPNIWCED